MVRLPRASCMHSLVRLPRPSLPHMHALTGAAASTLPAPHACTHCCLQSRPLAAWTQALHAAPWGLLACYGSRAPRRCLSPPHTRCHLPGSRLLTLPPRMPSSPLHVQPAPPLCTLRAEPLPAPTCGEDGRRAGEEGRPMPRIPVALKPAWVASGGAHAHAHAHARAHAHTHTHAQGCEDCRCR